MNALRAFTLIELLVVIAIIAVLIGLLFPVFGGAQNQARRAQAKNDVTQIVTAVNAYYTEYGVYPLNSGNNGGGSDTSYGDPNGTYSSADLCNILRAIPDSNYNSNNKLNARQVVFLSVTSTKDSTNPREGISTNTGNITNSNGYTIKPGSFVDPWGDEYVTFIDADYNNEITTSLGWFYPNEYQTGGTNRVMLGVGAASLGKDGKWGDANNGKASKTDDILSWE